MSFNVQKFNEAFQQAADFSAADASALIRVLVFLFFLIASILATIHWMAHASQHRSPMAYVSFRYLGLGVLLAGLVFVLFI